MNHWIVIALIAGLACAAMQASILNPSFITVFLFYLAPMPLFVAGLGWGPVAAAAGGLIAAAIFTVFASIKAGIFLLISTAVAPVVLSYLALLNRPATQGTRETEGEAAEAGVAWYPEGRLLLWAAVLCAALMTATIVLVGPDAASFEKMLRDMAATLIDQMAKQNPEVDKSKLAPLIDVIVVLVPLASVAMLLLATMVNLWLGAKLLTGSGRSLRPWAPFHDLAVPKAAVVALAAALVAAFMPGTIGLIGKVFAASLGTAFMLLGVAVVHGLTRHLPNRVMLLFTHYLMLLVFTPLMILPLIGLAMLDTIFGFRRRIGPPPAAPT